MLRNLNATYAGKRVLASPYVGVIASQIAAETADGDHGPGILYNEAIDPTYAGKYLRAWVTNPPAAGGLTVADDGAIEAVSLADGSYVFNYDLIVNDVYDSSSSFSVTVGVVNATATGGVGSGVGSGTGGNAIGESGGSATATGGTGTGVGSGFGGQADGQKNAVADGGVGSGFGSGSGGQAGETIYVSAPNGCSDYSKVRISVVSGVRPASVGGRRPPATN